MNNNREERLQMRQRGAATRKIKEVDFGFSFGLAPPEDSQPASQPELANGPPAPSAPSEPESSQPPLASEKQNTPPPWSQSSVQRTPGSARNALPERPSTFDIPADEAPSLGRSSKRRKIESPPTSRRVSPRRDGTLQGQKSSSPLRNGTRSSPPVPPPNESIEAPTITNVTENENQPTETTATSATAKDAQAGSPPDVAESAPKSALENTTEPVSEPALEKPSEELIRKSPEQQSVHAPEPSPEQLPHDVSNSTDVAITEPELQFGGEPDSNQAQPKSPLAQQAASQPNGTSSPADATRSKRKRGTSADERSSPSASPVIKDDASRPSLSPQPQKSKDSPDGKRKKRGTSAGGRPNASPETTDQVAQPPAQPPSAEQSVETSTEQRKTRGTSVRSSKSASPRPASESTQQVPRISTPEQSVDTSVAAEGKRRGASIRARSSQSASPRIFDQDIQPQAAEPEETPDAPTDKRTTRGASARGRPSKSASPRSVGESVQQPPQAATLDQPLETSTSKGKTRGASAGTHSAQSGSPEIGGETSQQAKQAPQTEEPQKATRGKRKRRGSSANRHSPQRVTALETAREEIEHPPPEEPQDTPMEAEPSELQPAKRQRGRPRGSTQKSFVSGEDAGDAVAAFPVDKSAKEPSPPRREPRGLRNRNAKKAMSQVAAEEEEPVAEPAQVEGASEANVTNHKEDRQPRQKLKAADKKSRRAGRGDKKAQAEEMSEEVPRPGRKGKAARKTQEPEQTQETEPEPERTPERQPEVEPETEPEPQPEPSTRKRGRDKPSQSKRDSQATQPEERATQDNAEETTTPRPQRKPRQPRGETVPVTVHRLANVASLGGVLPGTSSDEEDEDEDDDQETTEELSTRLKAKLPNRGGVNIADVLSQICRETLEKTLTTLNNGIANEGNAARRSEWTRKKKAVEAYGTELEGRLFELSEMLDSNFVLGVQLRKAKREMLDQRTRLFRLRKEREAVALRMDAVRQKHSEEENARATRSTINHSLHNIDLALERNKLHQPLPADPSASQNPSSSSPTVGLEFLLRSVAENASSRAPGAQGGLLSQIRAFNAQLESTARKLES